jgi:hypothetical protein
MTVEHPVEHSPEKRGTLVEQGDKARRDALARAFRVHAQIVAFRDRLRENMVKRQQDGKRGGGLSDQPPHLP